MENEFKYQRSWMIFFLRQNKTHWTLSSSATLLNISTSSFHKKKKKNTQTKNQNNSWKVTIYIYQSGPKIQVVECYRVLGLLAYKSYRTWASFHLLVGMNLMKAF